MVWDRYFRYKKKLTGKRIIPYSSVELDRESEEECEEECDF